MDEKIKSFIGKQTCAGICTVDERGDPYCFSCFYAFNCDLGLLFFKSSSSARHSCILANNPHVAGCGFFISGSALPIIRNELPQSVVHLKVDFDGRVLISSGASDIGQGSDTMLAMIVQRFWEFQWKKFL